MKDKIVEIVKARMMRTSAPISEEEGVVIEL